MRAWLYCRVTNGWDADSRDHLALQKAELERFCAEHDLTVPEPLWSPAAAKRNCKSWYIAV